jgi:hypothetical protein
VVTSMCFMIRGRQRIPNTGGVCHSPGKQLPSFEIVRYHASWHNETGTLQGSLYVLGMTRRMA